LNSGAGRRLFDVLARAAAFCVLARGRAFFVSGACRACAASSMRIVSLRFETLGFA
jgi:hypothetical protein